MPRALAAPVMKEAGVDRLDALYSAIDIVRRGGTISISGVYGGAADPVPMITGCRHLRHLSALSQAPEAYKAFQEKADGS